MFDNSDTKLTTQTTVIKNTNDINLIGKSSFIVITMFILFMISTTKLCYASIQVAETSASEQQQQHEQQQQQQQQQQQHQHDEQQQQHEHQKQQQHQQQDKNEQFQIPKDQIPLVRLPSNTLLKYTAYKDVSILHFRIPTDTRTALFTFKAYEESKSAFQRVCQPRDITLHLKAGSYPVISPENITFPRHFLSADQRFKIYSLQFKSNGRTQRLTIDGPQSGNWFAVAFISWTDPNNERIEQQGLAASCETLLLSEMSVSRIIPIIINNGQIQSNTLTNNENLNGTKEISYKFYVPRNVGLITGHFTIINSICNQQLLLLCPDIGIYIQANALPNTNQYNSNSIHSIIINSNQTGENIFDFYVQSSTWHYIDIKFLNVEQQKNGNHHHTGSNNAGFNDDDDDSSGGSNNGGSSSDNSANNDSNINGKNQNDPLQSWINGGGGGEGGRGGGAGGTGSGTITYNPNSNSNNSNNTSNNYMNGTSYEVDFLFEIDFHVEEEPSSSSSSSENTEQQQQQQQTEQHTGPEQPYMFRNIEFYPLLRQTYREFFMFDYDLIPDVNGTVPTLLNMTASQPVGFCFDVGDVYDIGGTLTFALSMKQDIKGNDIMAPMMTSTSILAEKLIDRPSSGSDDNDNVGGSDNNDLYNDKLSGRSNQTIIICMRLGEPGEPKWPDKCQYGNKILPASSIINNTDQETSTGLIHVPFPESGKWYVTMGLFCHGAETAARTTIIDSVKEFIKKYSKYLDNMKNPCSCTNFAIYYKQCIEDRKCLSQMNETETLKIKECLMDSKCTVNYIEMTKKFEIHHKFATEQSVATENCNTSLIFTISSSPCVAGRCGRYGRCYHYMSGGFVFSTCLCIKGYRGWDCTEDSQVPSSISILIASLLLTLSNLLFIPSIYFAIRRKYLTESVIYFFAMFFSIFYHACDSGEDEYSFCLVKIGVLQFCDFYCGLLAIWVTLIAMSHIRQQFVSLLHMFGAIILAFGTELNKQSLWVFLAPSLTGICIISTSWGLRCHKTHKWFPSKKYLTLYMPIGTILVMIGLCCYAFLQTKQNYHIVHSIWHMVMALSLLCLLPSRNSFIPKC